MIITKHVSYAYNQCVLSL